LFVCGGIAGFLGYGEDSSGIFDNAEDAFVWEDDTETESLNSILQRIQDSLSGLEDTEEAFDYYGEEIDGGSDIIEEIYLSYSYMEDVDQSLTEEDWEGDHSVMLLDGDMEALEELETEYGGQEGKFYLITVQVYNDTSEDLDASSIVVKNITFADGEGSEWVFSPLKIFYSYWEMIEAGHNGYQRWLIFVPDDMLDAAQEEYLTFSFTYETEQDGETVVNTYEDDVFYFD
ncbi:MAG: hypothetical protein LUE92_15935, partial [Clostridiales bacterium]|nr:hypothetical protein [Clostridiales bacterium]